MDTRFPTSDIDEIGPVDGLVAYYNCDSLQDTILLDNSGNNNNGTNYGATLTAGKNDNALSFNGSSYVLVPYVSMLAPTSQITVSCWVYSTNWSIDGRFTSKTETGGYMLGIASSNIVFYVYRNLSYGTTTYAATNLTNSTWYHFVGTYDGRYTKLYVNSVLVSTNDAGSTYPISYTYNNPLLLGAEAQSDEIPSTPYLTGLIDEVRIYNKALTSAEISQLYKLNSKKSTLITDNYESSLNYDQTVQLSNNLEGTSLKNLVTGQILGTSSNVTQNPGYLEFNGVDSYINIGDSARLNNGGTISCWYYARSSGENNYGRLIDKGTSTNALNGYLLCMYNSSNVTLTINNIVIIQSSSLPSLNAWHHIAVVIDSTKKEIWIDGVKVANNTNTTLPPDVAGNVYIGNRADNVDRTFDGYIKNVRIYTHSLDSEEIKFLYNKGK